MYITFENTDEELVDIIASFSGMEFSDDDSVSRIGSEIGGKSGYLLLLTL